MATAAQKVKNVIEQDPEQEYESEEVSNIIFTAQ